MWPRVQDNTAELWTNDCNGCRLIAVVCKFDSESDVDIHLLRSGGHKRIENKYMISAVCRGSKCNQKLIANIGDKHRPVRLQQGTCIQSSISIVQQDYNNRAHVFNLSPLVI